MTITLKKLAHTYSITKHSKRHLMNFPKKFDGFYFTPIIDPDDEGFNFKFFNLTEKNHSKKPIETSPIGDVFHICFVKESKTGSPEYDCDFEAILGDPTGYVMNLAGHGVYGCILRKTKTSGKWFEDYLTNIKMKLYNKKITKMLKSILEHKRNGDYNAEK